MLFGWTGNQDKKFENFMSIKIEEMKKKFTDKLSFSSVFRKNLIRLKTKP